MKNGKSTEDVNKNFIKRLSDEILMEIIDKVIVSENNNVKAPVSSEHIAIEINDDTEDQDPNDHEEKLREAHKVIEE